MTVKARQTLADAEVALNDFEASAGTAYWRTRWIAVITILRAVGHVAESVDGEQDAAMRAALQVEFKALERTKPEPRIFWDFIFYERNRALKEMLLGARMNISITPGAETVYDHFMADGIYAGSDPRVLAREAIVFWTAYLDRADDRAKAMRG